MTVMSVIECIIINTVFMGSFACVIDRIENTIEATITAISDIKSQLKFSFFIVFTPYQKTLTQIRTIVRIIDVRAAATATTMCAVVLFMGSLRFYHLVSAGAVAGSPKLSAPMNAAIVFAIWVFSTVTPPNTSAPTPYANILTSAEV